MFHPRNILEARGPKLPVDGYSGRMDRKGEKKELIRTLGLNADGQFIAI